jgi:hypothetical protein
MRQMDRAREAGGSGIAFTIVVVLAILGCIGLMVWRASSGDQDNKPPNIVQIR